jgi:integrase
MGVRVRKHKGSWYAFINHLKQRKAKKVGDGPDAERVARELADRICIRLVCGEGLEEPKETILFEDYAAIWLRNIAILKKPNTAETYQRHMANVWIPALGKLRLDQIARTHVKKVLIELQEKGYVRTYVLSFLTALQSCLSAAVDEEILKSNPADRQARNIKNAQPNARQATEIFTEAELRQLLDAAFEYGYDTYVKLLILARTGMHEGEMLALQPADIDFDKGTIWVRRTWGSRNTGRQRNCINLPKSGEWRWVDMSPQLSDVIQDYLARPPRSRSPWMFPGAGDSEKLPMHPSTFTYHWNRIMQCSGATRLTPHALRHTYASILIHAGENLLYIRDQLGHASIKVTMDTYGHLLPGQVRSRVDRLDDAGSIRNPGATQALRPVGSSY